MYSVAKGKQQQQNPIVCDIEYDEHLSPSFYGAIVCDILNYILYFRGQTPAHVNELKLQRNNLQKQCKATSSGEGDNAASLPQKKTDLTYLNKLEKFLTDLDKLCHELNDVTVKVTATHSLRVAILLGSTVITPKDVFVIELPKSGDLNHIPSRQHFARVLKKFVTWNELSQRPSTPLTNIYVLLDLPSSNYNISNWFVPKPYFNHLGKAQQAYLRIKILNENNAARNPDYNTAERYQEDCENEVPMKNCNEKCEHVVDEGASWKELRHEVDPDKDMCECSDDSSIPSLADLEINDTEEEEERLWFQAPIVLKGIQATMHSNAQMVLSTN